MGDGALDGKTSTRLMTPGAEPQPRRLKDRLERRGLGTRPADWVGRALALGGAIGLTLAVGAVVVRHQPVAGASLTVVACIGAIALGVALSALAAAEFSLAEAPRKVGFVLIQDFLMISVVLLFWALYQLGGNSGGGDGSSSKRVRAARSNFAVELVDPVATARLLGVGSVKVEGVGINNSVLSRAHAMTVDAAGDGRDPSLWLTVLQGNVDPKWNRLLRGRQQGADNTILEGNELTVREGDTLVMLRLNGFSGDAVAVLREAGRIASARLYVPAAAQLSVSGG